MFHGSIVALVTPWTEDGSEIDAKALKRLVDWHVEQGTNALVPCGTTGESPSFSHEEQHRMIALTVEYADGRVPVIAGAGSNNTREAVSLAEHAEKYGANGVLTITPYYNKPPQSGIVAHFKAVREACSLPLVLYNVPSRTGINMLPDTVAEVAALGGIDSVKEASGSLDQALEILNRGVRVLSGEDGLTWPLMSIGASGTISVVANFAPKLVSDMCAAAAAGDMQKAQELHRKVFVLTKLAFCETNPIPAKAAVHALGFCNDSYRLPLLNMTPGNREKLLTTMREMELL